MSDLSPTSQILLEARALLSDPSKWTQHYPARDLMGRQALAASSDAVCWCLSGALFRAMKTLGFQRSDFDATFEAVREQINPKIPLMSVVIDWNDDPSRTYEEVVALLEAAILRERAKRDSQASSEGLS